MHLFFFCIRISRLPSASSHHSSPLDSSLSLSTSSSTALLSSSSILFSILASSPLPAVVVAPESHPLQLISLPLIVRLVLFSWAAALLLLAQILNVQPRRGVKLGTREMPGVVSTAEPRIVLCPKCNARLAEPPPGTPIYRCSLCSTLLQGKYSDSVGKGRSTSDLRVESYQSESEKGFRVHDSDQSAAQRGREETGTVFGTSMEGSNLSWQSDSSEERADRVSDCSEVVSSSTVVSVNQPLHGRWTNRATSVRTHGFMPKRDASNGEKPFYSSPPRKPRPSLAPDTGGRNADGKESGVHQFGRERSSGYGSEDDSEVLSSSPRPAATTGSPVEVRNVVDGARISYSKDEHVNGFLDSLPPLQLKRISTVSANDAESERLHPSEGCFMGKSQDDREFSKYDLSPDVEEEDLQGYESGYRDSEVKHSSRTTPDDAGIVKLAGEKLLHASFDVSEGCNFSPQSPVIEWVRREQERRGSGTDGNQAGSQSRDAISTGVSHSQNESSASGDDLPYWNSVGGTMNSSSQSYLVDVEPYVDINDASRSRSDQSSEHVSVTDEADQLVQVGMQDLQNVAVESLQQHFHINGHTPNHVIGRRPPTSFDIRHHHLGPGGYPFSPGPYFIQSHGIGAPSYFGFSAAQHLPTDEMESEIPGYERNFQGLERWKVSDEKADTGFLVNQRKMTETDTPCVKIHSRDTRGLSPKSEQSSNMQSFVQPASWHALRPVQKGDLQGRGLAANEQLPDAAPSHGAQDHCFGHSAYGHQQTFPQVYQSHQGFTATSHGLPLPSVTHTFPLPPPQEATTTSASAQDHPFAYGLQQSVYPFCPFCIQQSHLQHHQMLEGTLQQHYAYCSPHSMYAATMQQPLPHSYWAPFISPHIDPFLLYPQVTSFQRGAPVQMAQRQGTDAREKSEDCPQKQKWYPPLPRQGAAPFVLCQCCNKLLQVPPHLPPSSGSIRKLRCGACMKISKFTVSQTGLASLKNGCTPSNGHSVLASAGCASRSVCSSAEENIEMDAENGHPLDYYPSSPPIPKTQMKVSSVKEQLMGRPLQEDGSLSPSSPHRHGNRRLSESYASASTISAVESRNSARHSRHSSASFQGCENFGTHLRAREPHVVTGNGSTYGELHSLPPTLPVAISGSPLHEHFGYMSPAELLGGEELPVLGKGLDKQKDEYDRSSSTNRSTGGSPIRSPVPASPLHELLALESSDFGRKAQGDSPHHFGSNNESAARSSVPGSPLYEHLIHETSADFDESLYKKESPEESIKGRDEAGQDAGKGNKSFAGFLRRSLRELAKGNQGSSNFRRKVMINTHLVPDAMVKKAEEHAGIIHPGSYWYDYQAGFWGVMGGPCLGIIPPFIEELNYPMSRDCAGGKTGVLVNGRELHYKDLEVLARRGLPAMPGKSYTIEINGRVVDEASSQQLKSLGKLAPTIEKKGRGYGMFQPPSIQPGSARNRA